jgi:hypothetical protein
MHIVTVKGGPDCAGQMRREAAGPLQRFVMPSIGSQATEPIPITT